MSLHHCRVWFAILVAASLCIVATAAAQPARLTCIPGGQVMLQGQGGPVGAPLLARFDNVYVGGGSVKPGGWWSIPLSIDPATKAGEWPVTVEVRGTREVMYEAACVVPGTGEVAPTPTATAERGNCDPSYPDVCIAPAPPDLNCDDIPHTNIRVVGDDPHRLDADNDGIGCEEP